MNWKTILIYLLIFIAGVIVGKIKVNVKFTGGSCPTSLPKKYRLNNETSETSDYL